MPSRGSSVCGRCYIAETSRTLEVGTKEHKYNLTSGLLEKSKLSQHAYMLGRGKRLAHWTNHLIQEIQGIHRSVNTAWTSLPPGLPLSQQKSTKTTNPSSVD
jgi:hypothetical protein